ncbi:regulator of G protein signaling domain-containing protein [Mrakia frigida]|uniref:regulator of G protein signaling domain-containing protein n=1 Tax=Mrakia frigida TaxID=29902 RepID=UPI003FCC21BF
MNSKLIHRVSSSIFNVPTSPSANHPNHPFISLPIQSSTPQQILASPSPPSTSSSTSLSPNRPKPRKGVSFDPTSNQDKLDPEATSNNNKKNRDSTLEDGMSQATNHMMKNSKRGRPFVRDIHDMFSTLIVSLQLETHRQFFKSYPNSFTTDEACLNLSSLKFSQSNRSADPKDPARIITTTTTTTFTMSRDMAKDMCQHFIDARLIENAADPSSMLFKDRGVYVCTPKGLHILERFVAKNGISQAQLLKVFASQPICMKLLHLERRTTDDELYTSRPVVEMLWRRFAGRSPNLIQSSDPSSSTPTSKPLLGPSQSSDQVDQTQGIAVRTQTLTMKGKSQTVEWTMGAMSMVDWLLDFTTMAQREEAVENAAQFVRHGFVELVQEKGRINKETGMILTVKGKEEVGLKAEAEFRCTDKAIYRVTEHGARSARWGQLGGRGTPPPPSDERNSKEQPHDERYQGLRVAGGGSAGMDAKLLERLDISDKVRTEFLEHDLKASGFNALKESHTTKLTQILDEPALRSLFREFLRSNFCEENLNYWLDVQDFKRRFSTSSSAAAGPGSSRSAGTTTMEKHHQDLIGMAFVIYNSFLAPHSPSELNIDHNLRGELVAYVTKNLPDAASATNAAARSGTTAADNSGQLDAATVGQSMHASQLQTMLRMYERIQAYIFRLMATDSVPKFCKTERFMSLMRSVHDWDPSDSDAALPPAAIAEAQKREDEDHHEKAYMTVSQAANEKHAAVTKAPL